MTFGKIQHGGFAEVCPLAVLSGHLILLGKQKNKFEYKSITTVAATAVNS